MICRAKQDKQLNVPVFKLSHLNCVSMFSEVKEDEWEELGSDIAALHRLQGLSEHMFDESFMNTSTTRYLTTVNSYYYIIAPVGIIDIGYQKHCGALPL